MEDDSSLCSEANSEHINLSKSVDCKISHLTDEVVSVYRF